MRNPPVSEAQLASLRRSMGNTPWTEPKYINISRGLLASLLEEVQSHRDYHDQLSRSTGE